MAGCFILAAASRSCTPRSALNRCADSTCFQAKPLFPPQHAPMTTSLGRHVRIHESVGPLLRVQCRNRPKTYFPAGLFVWGDIVPLRHGRGIPWTHDTQIAGVIAFYPYCYDNVVPSPPTLILIGEKDDWTPAGMCKAVKGNPNFDVVVYPGASHSFAMPMGEPIEALGGHHLAFAAKAL